MSQTSTIYNSIEQECCYEKLIFDFRRALFWEKKKMLIIADLHIGKTAHFRKNGIPISNSVSRDDFKRLEDLIKDYKAEEVLILGDLSHSVMNREWDSWIEFRNSFQQTEFKLVPGNHDILPEKAYLEGNIELLDETFESGPFTFVHDKDENKSEDGFYISGHVHPAIRMRGKGRQGLTLPCFVLSDKNILLPAFSGFTGGHKIRPKKGEKVLPLSSKGLFLIEN